MTATQFGQRTYSLDVIEDLKATTPAGSVALRSSLINAIWGGPMAAPLRDLKDGFAFGANPVGLFQRTPYSAQWIIWDWQIPISNSLMARVHYSLFTGSTRLLVYVAGHGQGFFTPADYPPPVLDYIPAGVSDFLRRSAEHCDILLVSMPLDGENFPFRTRVGKSIDPSQYRQSLHWDVGTKPEWKLPVGSQLRVFLDQIFFSITHALNTLPYEQIIMAGLSGGAWSTLVCAALDPRIDRAYAVGGSVPLAYRHGGEGDWEQLIAGELVNNADYSDLALMAVAEVNRSLWLIHHGYDESAFFIPRVAPWLVPLQNFGPPRGYGSLKGRVDPSSGHTVSLGMANDIIADFMAA